MELSSASNKNVKVSPFYLPKCLAFYPNNSNKPVGQIFNVFLPFEMITNIENPGNIRHTDEITGFCCKLIC